MSQEEDGLGCDPGTDLSQVLLGRQRGRAVAIDYRERRSTCVLLGCVSDTSGVSCPSFIFVHPRSSADTKQSHCGGCNRIHLE